MPGTRTRAREGRSPDQVIARRSGQRTLYDVLQVSARADMAVLQAAYRALARAYHPDLHPADVGQERMRELNEAYHRLSDPRRRAIYDLSLNQKRADAPPADEAAAPLTEQVSVKRRTSCWRCRDPLEGAFSRYCGECHWLICDDCGSCGCQRPGWKKHAPRQRSPRPLTANLGWIVAGLASLGWLVTALIPWLRALGVGVGG
jgi:hypothetical protein